jgi:hypothetical protein
MGPDASYHDVNDSLLLGPLLMMWHSPSGPAQTVTLDSDNIKSHPIGMLSPSIRAMDLYGPMASLLDAR